MADGEGAGPAREAAIYHESAFVTDRRVERVDVRTASILACKLAGILLSICCPPAGRMPRIPMGTGIPLPVGGAVPRADRGGLAFGGAAGPGWAVMLAAGPVRGSGTRALPLVGGVVSLVSGVEEVG